MGTLLNKRIVITRAEQQADELARLLRDHGAIPLLHPAIAIVPPADPSELDAAVHALDQYDWVVFTSTNAVRAVCERIDWEKPWHARLAAVGPTTAAALAELGLAAACVPSRPDAEGLLEALGDMAGKRVLLPSADIARDTLADGLVAQGAIVQRVTAYRTVTGPGGKTLAPELRAGRVDGVTFTSPSTIRSLLEGLYEAGVGREEARQQLNQITLVVIGHTTAAEAHAHGLNVFEAPDTSAHGLVAALIANIG